MKQSNQHSTFIEEEVYYGKNPPTEICMAMHSKEDRGPSCGHGSSCLAIRSYDATLETSQDKIGWTEIDNVSVYGGWEGVNVLWTSLNRYFTLCLKNFFCNVHSQIVWIGEAKVYAATCLIYFLSGFCWDLYEGQYKPLGVQGVMVS